MKDKKTGLWTRILDVLFPPRCVFCHRVTVRERPVCSRCREYLPWLREEWEGGAYRAFDGFCSPLSYEGLVRRTVLSFKEKGGSWEGDCLADLMTQSVKESFPEEKFSAVVPVPASPARLQKRGFNQAELLSQRIAKNLEIPHKPQALRREDTAQIQHHLSARDRERNALEHYQPGEEILDGTVLLVDDVATTGATLHACAIALKGLGARKVIAVSAAATLRKTGNLVEK